MLLFRSQYLLKFIDFIISQSFADIKIKRICRNTELYHLHYTYHPECVRGYAIRAKQLNYLMLTLRIDIFRFKIAIDNAKIRKSHLYLALQTRVEKLIFPESENRTSILTYFIRQYRNQNIQFFLNIIRIKTKNKSQDQNIGVFVFVEL